MQIEANDLASASSQHADGVTFSMESNCWKPVSNCGQQVLPEQLPAEASAFVFRRGTCADVQQSQIDGMQKPLISPQHFMLGVDCSPNVSDNDLCSQCQRPWKSASREHVGQFIMRTYLGAVLRLKYQLVCICSARLAWDPCTEYIYTIRDNTEGGLVN